MSTLKTQNMDGVRRQRAKHTNEVMKNSIWEWSSALRMKSRAVKKTHYELANVLEMINKVKTTARLTTDHTAPSLHLHRALNLGAVMTEGEKEFLLF